MNIDFWQQRWQANQIGFHQTVESPYLDQYLSQFQLQSPANVFIPLCGKSLDINWFASHNFSVLGIECSEKAIKDFFKEQNIDADIKHSEAFSHYTSNNITLLQGDFFKLSKNDLKDINLVYDRASLVALPQEKRQQYVDLLINTLPNSAVIFLITLDYEQKIMSGPPFSVEPGEVEQLFSSSFKIEPLHKSDVLDTQLKFKERGLTYLTERVYKLTRI